MAAVEEISAAEAAQLRMRAAMSRARPTGTVLNPAAVGAAALGADTPESTAAKPGMLDSIRNWYNSELKDKKRREANVKCLTQLGIFVGLSVAIAKLGKKGMGYFDMSDAVHGILQQQMMMQ